jgi:putative methionine-R-sulfoxide reductase with GAF domain
MELRLNHRFCAVVKQQYLLWAIAIALSVFAVPTKAWGAQTLPSEVTTKYGDMQLRGSGQLRFLGMKVYNASLYVKQPVTGNIAFDRDFALDIAYLMSLKGAAIAERSVKEMRKVGYEDEAKLARWASRMKEIFPDVQSGDHLIGVFDVEESASSKAKASFYIVQKGKPKPIGAVDDAEFAQAFFDIWLSAKTSEPKLRAALLNAPARAPGTTP